MPAIAEQCLQAVVVGNAQIGDDVDLTNAAVRPAGSDGSHSQPRTRTASVPDAVRSNGDGAFRSTVLSMSVRC